MKTRLSSKLPSGANVLSKCLRGSCFPVFVSLIVLSCVHKTDRVPIIESKCGTCHSTDKVYKMKRSRAEWDILVSGMKTRGLVLSPSEEKQVMDVLYTKFGNGK